MNNSPFFSIIIPCYNRANFIKKTLESVLIQDFNNFEIIIVDDGSFDNTKEIIDSFGDSKLRYYWKENEERGEARNFGIRKAKGKYIVFLDSDDIMLSNHLKILYNNIINNQKYIFFATKYNIVNEKNIIIDSPLKKYESGGYDYRVVLKGNPFACNFCVKNSKEKFQLFESDRRYSIMEDWMFLVENLINNEIFIIDQVTIHMINHDNRSMTENNQKVIIARENALSKLLKNDNLSINNKKILIGYSAYFCAIHSYLDNNRTQSIRYILKQLKSNGLNINSLILLIKSLIGYEVIKKLK
ncbi:glycosyltransferase family 2 protein [Flammeovirga agarivorans]|uniref:Glycosyltransferase family 2 protein n=1 Tax=Flammeovirga agarivorans TaxID=2726742 RepID=A0A7X8SLM6_9BACT|nr:glycosyltransferase family 2 protein [Flammeovirga agarivorans]NLR92501.1 glycosyltransferase family 2 protein [Flammeovirga agarivorans]